MRFTCSALQGIVNACVISRSLPATAALENRALKCHTCGKPFTLPPGQEAAGFVALESTRCARLREIAQQRQALSLRLQGGIVGMVGSDTVDTIDMVAHRKSLAQLDATLAGEAQELSAAMSHKPDGL